MADSKSGMNLPSRTSAVLTDLRSGISGSIQDTVRLKQEWTSLGQVIQTAGSRAGGLAKGGGPGGMSSSKIAPDPNFGQQQQASNNQVFSSPAQNAIGGGPGGPGGVPGGPGSDGGASGGDGGGMFRNLSEYISQNRTGAILYGAGTALGSAHATSDMVQAQLLMQRSAAFLPKDPGVTFGNYYRSTSGPPLLPTLFSAGAEGNLTSRYEYIRRSAADMALGGAPNDKMDAFNAMAAAQSYGVGGATNFMQRAGTNDQFQGSIMSGISNVSNLTPGMGLEGTTRAYGGMQRAKSVNMLRSVGIKIRDENGNMKPMDVIIDDLWTKICRDVMKDGKGKPTEQEMLIGFQPGNSMDSMVQNLFGDDPLVYTAIKNGLIYKAKTGGAAITRDGANQAGMTTNAVQTRQETQALGTQGVANSSNAGAFSYNFTQDSVNEIFTKPAIATDEGLGVLGPLKALNATAAMLQTLGGTPGGNAVANFFAAMLGMGQKREAGGPVSANATPYIVGEKGPELFIPKTDGVIIPNDLGPARHKGGGVKAGGDKSPLDDQKLRGILSGAGFKGQALEDAMKVVRWESGGVPSRHSHPSLTKDDSHGLFQINMLGALGPERRKKYGLKSDDDLYDPETNARVAYTIYKGSNGFANAWVTSASKLASKGKYDKNGNALNGSVEDSAYDSSGVPIESPILTAKDNTLIKDSFISTYGDKKGAQLFKAFEEYNKTGKLPTGTTVASMLGMDQEGMSAMSAAMGGAGGSTVNYGGVTFNITTPADNKSFIDSVKQALKDLNFLKIGRD